MIKAEDLRIGDIVRYGKNTITILAVHANGGVCFTDGKDQLYAEDVLLEPILLTPEILEKNGFEVVYPEKCHMKFIGPPRGLIRLLSIEKVHTELKVFVKYSSLVDHVLLRSVYYVHELQHILWALGESSDINI